MSHTSADSYPVKYELSQAVQSLTKWLEEKFLGSELVAIVGDQSKICINIYHRRTVSRIRQLQLKEYMGYTVEFKYVGPPQEWSEWRKRKPN